jgi:hypothetical protein
MTIKSPIASGGLVVRGDDMTAHPLLSEPVPFRGRDAGEIDVERAQRLADVQRYAPRYLAAFRRAYAGKSLRAAVNAFCIECNGFDAAAVRECTAPACPLWHYRPSRTRKGKQ